MKLKLFLVALVSAGIGFGVALFWLNEQRASHNAGSETASPTSQSARAEAAAPPAAAPASRAAAKQPAIDEALPTIPARRSLQELLDELVAIQVTPGPGQARAQYRILALLDQLAQGGPPALPAIRQFLAGNRDVAYSSAGRNAQRNTMLPPSLRMGLFDVVRQIGGADSELLLSESLAATGRAAELTYVAQLLETSAPGKYQDAALTAARNLLAGGKVSDRSERDQLYDLLLQARDTSLVSTAQAGLIQADGRVDGSALRYLQQSLGEKSLAVAAQTFQDGRVVDADSKEALGRLALNYVGANDQALELYHKAALDAQLKPDQRRNLVEDLNQDGLSNRRNPTPEDLKLIANRYTLTQSYLQQDYVKNDKLLNAAFLEAHKDLANLLQRAGVTPPAKPPGN